ncbi:zinc finger CCCH-type antiviral protein 1-like [Thamnophis elegans]|uniref:zinc finger CCCH-type antiviral protein 1-like n=1 Tax=Thamnophis elegans TaxID=35005 RepID=UPI001377AFB6|nr:zinc finger CCCH-type antiviral protein 1-like [Thamnophis elegans]
MADPSVCIYLCKVLCSRGGGMRLSELPDQMGLPLSQVRQILDDAGQGRFLVVRRGADQYVLAVTAARLCVRQVCTGCDKLHLCKLNLRARCRTITCKYPHEIFSESNRNVLKNHELIGLNEEELCILLLQNDSFLLPDVCGGYNKKERTCTLNGKCRRLHICRYFLRGECRFPHCKRSHDLLDPVPASLLLAEGLDEETIWNIQAICDARIAAFIKDLKTPNCPPAAEKDDPSTRPKNQRSQNADNFVMVDRPDQGAKRAPKFPSAEKEKSDEICVYYLWQFCKNKNNCSMIHYDLPYRWQIHTSNGWKDLPRREEIEQAYCDPNITRFPDLGLDFTTLTSATSPIRRLSTPSSVTKEPKFVMTTMWLWYWKSDQGQWFEYGKQATPALKSILKKPEKNNQIQPASVTSEDLENLYQADPTGNVQFEAGSQQYVLSFKYMTQTNENYSTQREVRRRPKFVSSEDVRTKKGHTAGATTITTAAVAAAAAAAAATPTPIVSPVTIPTYPPYWDNTALPSIGYAAIELHRDSQEFLRIEGPFQQTMKNHRISKIHRIQNPSLWQVYQWQKEQMKKKKGGQNIDERYLFHGTVPSCLKAICADNFDWRLCGTNGTVYGKGSYFARDASYSDNYCQPNDNEKMMFLAQVLVGEFIMGHPTYTRPPAKLSNMLNPYDSCVDNPSNPSIFVIFEKHQVYPAYLIYYREEKKCILS